MSVYFMDGIEKKLDTRVIIFIAFIGAAFSLEIVGPSVLLGLPESFTLLLIGYMLLGIFMSFLYVPLMPEMIKAIEIGSGMKNQKTKEVGSSYFN